MVGAETKRNQAGGDAIESNLPELRGLLSSLWSLLEGGVPTNE